jgi:hypothetical protein
MGFKGLNISFALYLTKGRRAGADERPDCSNLNRIKEPPARQG